MIIATEDRINEYIDLTENAHLTLGKDKYSLNPSTREVGHGYRTKIASNKQKVNSRTLTSIAIDVNEKAVNLNNSHKASDKEAKKDYKELVDIVSALLDYDADSLIDIDDNKERGNEGKFQDCLNRFSKLSKDEIKMHFKNGRQKRIEYNGTAEYISSKD